MQDAMQRDLTTARRAALLEILWHERYLTRPQLISRVEMRLGRYCFGRSSWEDNFYRDMRLVKKAFQAASMQLRYSRSKRCPGYFIEGEPALSRIFKEMLINSAAEADSRQIDVYRRLPASQRFRQGCSISDTARKAVAYRIRQENPDIDASEAQRRALQRAYSP